MRARAPSKSEPHTSIASDAMAGVPMRLVQRRELFHEATAPSSAAASTAAGMP